MLNSAIVRVYAKQQATVLFSPSLATFTVKVARK